jgi:hypothetical protein
VTPCDTIFETFANSDRLRSDQIRFRIWTLTVSKKNMTSHLNASLPTILTSPATGTFKKPPLSLDLSSLSIVPGQSDELSPLFAGLPHEQAPVEARAFSVVLCSGGILVRDPPRGRLSRPAGTQVVSTFSLVRISFVAFLHIDTLPQFISIVWSLGGP